MKGNSKRKMIYIALALVAIVAVIVIALLKFVPGLPGNLAGTVVDQKIIQVGDTFEMDISDFNPTYDVNYLAVADIRRVQGMGIGWHFVYTFKGLKVTGDSPTEVTQKSIWDGSPQTTDIIIKERPLPADITANAGETFVIDMGWINLNPITHRVYTTVKQYDNAVLEYDGFTEDKRRNPDGSGHGQFNAHHSFKPLQATDAWGTDIVFERKTYHVLVTQ